MSRSSRNRKPPRVWPAILVLVLAGAALAWIWARPDSPVGMSQRTLTLVVGLAAALLLLAWWLFFSRTRLLTRLSVTLALVALAGTLNAFFEIRGFSGDLVPQVAWRWSRPEASVMPRAVPAPTDPSSPDTAGAPRDDGAATEGSRDGTADPSSPDATGAPRDDGAESGAPRDDGAGFPQFLGPDRDAKLHGVSLARSWETSPPVALWRQPIGKGWSGFAVAKGLAVTQEQRDDRESVVAYDLATGAVRWSHRGGRGFESAMAGDGPRATPAVEGDRVYTLGVNGVLTALDLPSGRVLFERDVLAENGAGRPDHGVAASPLVVDGLVVVAAGGPGGRSLVAYDARTGERRWSGGDDPAAYSSPMLATLGGVPQILLLTRESLAGHDRRTGAVLWRDPWPERTEKVAQPVVLDGDRVFASMGYGIGGRLLRVARGDAGWGAEVVWRTRDLKAKFTQVVFHQGFLYGLDEGVLVCLDPATGARRWKSGRYGHGQVLLVDDVLLVQAEDGEVVMVDPNPEKLVELTRFQAVEGRAWATPALAGDLLLVRGDVEAACYRLPMKGA